MLWFGQSPGAHNSMTERNLQQVDSNLWHYNEILGDEVIDVYVGPSSKRFVIHKKVLCAKGQPTFDKMFQGEFKEAAEHELQLPEDDPDAFLLFAQWLYSDALPPIDHSLDAISNEALLFNRFKLYCFAEKYLLDSLMNHTIYTIWSVVFTLPKVPSTEAIQYSFQNTHPRSELREFFKRCEVAGLLDRGTTNKYKHLP
ncbi:hypothetical protein EG329_007112 [Mollisiaceae sp. DMI_Dod_QoI]|nr:hypothetical protein EG329_007112 [Helotiales sp. DMI_Dod_QoI]